MKQEIAVAAWAESDDARSEAMQALVSQWRPADEWPGFAAADATQTGGLATRGYFGAVCDGRYVYFVPEQHGEGGYPTHGNVLRLDTLSDFRDPSSFSAYDAGHTQGLQTRGYYGAVFDGRYVYFVPRQIDMDLYHSRVLRLDTTGDFHDPASWDAHDVGEAHSQQSAVFDGRYIYFCPGFSGDPHKEDEYCGRVIRYDTRAGFHDPSAYVSIDMTTFLGKQAACFDGGAFDGRYVYFVPLYKGYAVRYDTQAPFDSPEAWQGYDVRPHGFKLAVGAVFDGTWLYYCAYGHGTIVRFDTGRDFDDAGAWESMDADHTDGLRTTGFDGGFFDGRFVYFQPFFLHVGPGPRDNRFHAHYLRYDVTRPFGDADSWQAFDASATDGLHSVGYNGGAFDGRYFYAAPWQQGPKPDGEGGFVTHGIVLRCDTLGDDSAFSLRWCDLGHNGGLNAGILGPSFLVNTDRGCARVFSPRPLSAGRHHVVGTYDGQAARLFIDGTMVAEREHTGKILKTDLPVSIGRIQDGAAHFRGRVLHWQVEPTAMNVHDVTHLYETEIPHS